MDLHSWTTRKVDRAELTGRHITLVPGNGSHAISGTVTDVTHGPTGVNLAVARHGDEPAANNAALVRRCEADRRILARHRAVNDGYSVACGGCGYDGGHCPEPVTENINDCPELLDLAHAHGLTPAVLAGLDRPAPPKRDPAEPGVLGQVVAQVRGDSLRTTRVPAALRGTNWKARP